MTLFFNTSTPGQCVHTGAAAATAKIVKSSAAGMESSGAPGVRCACGSLNWRSASFTSSGHGMPRAVSFDQRVDTVVL